jgi:hypothetical protein
MNLASAQDRDDVVQVFEGLSQQYTMTDQGPVAMRRPLVKSYMFETVPPQRTRPALADLFRRVNHRVVPVDGDSTLYKVQNNETQQFVGVVEQLLDRHPVYYTQAKSDESDRLTRRLVEGNPELDHLWISGRVFEQLHQIVLRTTQKHRYGRLVFEYTSLFESEDQPGASGSDVGDGESADFEDVSRRDDDDVFVPERRNAKFTMVERLAELEVKLPQMRDIYRPLYAISQLRFPGLARGGHDFYSHGKVTNRTDSFSEHRQRVQFVLDLYSKLTSETETLAWSVVEKTAMQTAGRTTPLVGAPVVLEFFEPLTQRVYDEFVRQTFRHENNRFRLWGDPISLGPSKCHVYAVDRHIWQPLFLEITTKRITVIVPHGTCGNSIHRLITNVQQYLDPAVRATVAGIEYDQIVSNHFEPEGGHANAAKRKRPTL